MKWKMSLFASAIAVMAVAPMNTEASKTTVTSYPVSSGVTYEQYKYTAASVTNNVNHLTVNLNDPFTKVALGLADTQNGRMTTTAMANAHSKEGHRVVGAINAGFFDMSVGNPLLLLADNNEIINGGRISVGTDEFVNKPYAFGVKEDGSPAIELFDFDIAMQYGGKNYELSGLNRKRYDNEAIVFTPQHYLANTGQNSFGVEIVVDTGKTITENTFGQTLTGKITHIFPYTEKWPAKIPDTGFVLSVHGTPWRAMMEGMKVGEEVSVNFSINKDWDNADFMIATGPLLVEDGKVNLQMDPNSARAKQVAPRTVVGVDEDTNKVHYITVDGRQKVSQGMNMSQLAKYLVNIGVDTAINLDGGGSTAMGVRRHGSNEVVLANVPSDGGTQRRVSTILEAISTAPTSEAVRGNVSRSRVGTFLVGANSSVTSVTKLMDSYYNAIPIDKNKLSLSSEKGTISGKGLTYTMNEPGTDRLQVAYDGAIFQTYPITTVSGPSELYLKANNTTVDAGGTIQFSTKALDADKNELLYDKYQLKYEVEGDIGTIDSNGKFTANKQGGEGKVIVRLGDQAAGVKVVVKKEEISKPPATSMFKDLSPTYTYLKEITYLAQNKYFMGYEDGTFRPDQNLSRAHAAVIISRILKLDTSQVTNPNFIDVAPTYTYYKEIAAVQNLGIISGDGNKFKPTEQLTRGQMAKILTLAFTLEGDANKVFTDVSPNGWEHEYVQALAANNITTGYEDGSFKPRAPISRAHFAVFLYRTLTK